MRPSGFRVPPQYLLMYPSPSPSHVWKRRRICSSSPVLDVSPPPALPAAGIMRPLPAREEEDARPREGSARRKSGSQPRTCLTTEHAQWPPGAPGAGFQLSGFCAGWEDARSAIAGGGEGGSWSRGATGAERTRRHAKEGRVHGDPLEGCQLRVSDHNADP